VVAAASYEARKFGVRSAMPSVTALRKCPHLVFVRPRFEVYRAVSQQIRAIFAEFTPLIEPLSLDEAYLDVTDEPSARPATVLAEEIRARIRAATGLTASAGVSYNKFLAKLASDHNKPDGLFVITPAMGPAFVESLAIGRFHGIGPATAAKMNRLGIFTGADLKAQSLEFLQHHFGKAGHYFHGVARAVDERPVRPDRARKSIGTEVTLAEDVTRFEPAWHVVQPLIDKVWRHCQAAGLAAGTLTLKVKYADFRQITRSATPKGGLARLEQVEALTAGLLRPLFPPPRGIRLLGVTLSSLSLASDASEARQLPLL
jgi:DNA polymerase-4